MKKIGEIIGPILTIMAATSGFWYFFLYENVEIHYQSVNETLKVKNNALKEEKSRLEKENEKLTKWLTETPNSIPYYEKKVASLQRKINSFQELSKKMDTSGIKSSKPISNILPESYRYFEKLGEGETFIDPLTKTSISLYNIDNQYSALAKVDYPDGFHSNESNMKEIKVTSGMTWDDIIYENRSFKLIIKNIDPLFDEFTIEIVEL